MSLIKCKCGSTYPIPDDIDQFIDVKECFFCKLFSGVTKCPECGDPVLKVNSSSSYCSRKCYVAGKNRRRGYLMLSAKMQATLIHMMECTGLASTLKTFWTHKTFVALEKRDMVKMTGKFSFEVTDKGKEMYKKLKEGAE